jgi:hypothetical protein
MIQLRKRRCVLFDVDGTVAETEGNAHLPGLSLSTKNYRRL